MNHSIDAFETMRLPESGFVFEVGSLYERFASLHDARDPRGKRYALALVLLLIVLAKLCGEDEPEAIADWARLRLSELSELLPLERATLPCANTYRQVVREAVAPDALQALIGEFLQSQAHGGRSVLICIDGKTLRGTLSADPPSGGHLLAAYLPAEGLVLMQLAVETKTNEMSVAPRLLKSLDLRDKIVMGDALHTQRALSIQILSAGGAYIWYAKDNQPKLHQDIAQRFVPERTGKGSRPVPTDFRTATQSDCGHGRIEKRTLTTSSLLRDYLDWPGVQQVFKLERVVMDLHLKPLRSETVYGLTSLTAAEASPLALIAWTRGYWSIENGLHYRRDVTLHEDATRMRHPRAAQVWASLNNLLVGLLQPLGQSNLPHLRRAFAANLIAAVAVFTHRIL